MRPDFGSVVLARTAGMVEQEKLFYGYALWATEETWGVRVTAQALLSALELQCGVKRSAVKLEVTSPPYHFFLRFDSEDECTRVVLQSRHLTCCGTRMVFVRWSSRGRGVPGKKEFKCTLSFDGLPEEAQEPQSMNLLVAAVDGEIIEMLPATDRWITPVCAWLRDPCSVPKKLNVKIPASPAAPATWSEENGESPPPPWSPTSKEDQNVPVLVHMKTVIDRGFLLDAGLDCYSESPDRDLTRKHHFSTWRGRIDGTGPGDNGDA